MAHDEGVSARDHVALSDRGLGTPAAAPDQSMSISWRRVRICSVCIGATTFLRKILGYRHVTRRALARAARFLHHDSV